MCKSIISSFLNSCLLFSCDDVFALHAALCSLLIILPPLTPSSLLSSVFRALHHSCRRLFHPCLVRTLHRSCRSPFPFIFLRILYQSCRVRSSALAKRIAIPSHRRPTPPVEGIPFALSLFYSCYFRSPSCRPMLTTSLFAGDGYAGEACEED